MKPSRSHLPASIVFILFALLAQHSAFAITDTWKSTAADNNFSNAANYDNSAPTLADTALFNSASNFTSLTIGSATQAVTSISFSTASAAAYTIGTTGGNSITLGSGGSISMDSAVVNTETVNAPLLFNSNTAAYTFSNASTAANLVIGGSIATTRTGGAISTLTISGVGTTSVTGNISDGNTGGKVAISVGVTTAGTVALSGDNTNMSGGVTLNLAAQVLQLGSDTALGSGTFNIAQNGTVQAITGDRSISNAITLNNSSTISGSQNLTLTGIITLNNNSRALANNITTGKLLTLSGNTLFLGTDNVPGHTLTISGTGNTTISDTIKDTSNVTPTANNNFAITNSGTTLISGTNTYSGNTTLGPAGVTTGVIQAGSDAAFGTSTVNFAGAALQANAARTFANNFTVGIGNGSVTGSQNITINGTFTNNGSNRTLTNNFTSGIGLLTLAGQVNLSESATTGRTFGINGTGDTLISGNIVNFSSGAGGFTSGSSGITELSGNNSYTGTTTLAAGILKLSSTNAIPGGIGASGGTGPLTVTGGVIGLNNGDFLRPLGLATAGAVSFTTTANAGFAAYGADRVVNFGGTTPTVTFGSGNFLGGILILGATTADHTIDFQNNLSLAAASRTVQVDDGSASLDATISGVISSTNSSGSLTKTGAGTLALTAATGNTYTGSTSISAGKLRITNLSGSATGSGAVNASGGTTTTLSGNGFSSGLATFTNGTRIAPGVNISGINGNFGAAGTLGAGTTGGLTLTDANLDFDLASTATVGGGVNDLITTTALTLGSTIAFTFNGLNGSLATGTNYRLIDGTSIVNPANSSAITTTFLGSLAGNYTANYTSDSGNGDLLVSFTAVPEPSTWASMVMGGMFLVAAGSRRRKLARW